MASTYSPGGPKSHLERLREACKNTADQIAHERRNIINDCSSMALEIHEMQVEYIAALEEELRQWKLRCQLQDEELEKLRFELRTLRTEQLQRKFPTKGKKRG